MIEHLVPALNAVNMDLSRPYPRSLLLVKMMSMAETRFPS